MKVCRICNEEMAATSEYFHIRKDSKDGLRSECKKCSKGKMGKYYQKNKEEFSEYNKIYYQNNKEDIGKRKKENYNKDQKSAYNKQYYQNNKEILREKYKIYRDNNKDAVSASGRKYYEENRELILKKNKIYRNNNKEKIRISRKIKYEKNKESLLENKKIYYENNKEEILKRNKAYRIENSEKLKEYLREYRQLNPDVDRKAKHRRKSMLKKLPATLDLEHWGKIKNDFNNQCAYCGKTEEESLELFNEQLHQEHFIPLSGGGEYTHNNIIPACKSCNCSKKDKNFFDWYPIYEHYDKKREKFILEYLGYTKNIQQLSIL